MTSFNASLIYYAVKTLGALVRFLPVGAALAVGRFLGCVGYVLQPRRARLVYRNLRTAFSSTHNPEELKQLARRFFQNYAQHIVELLRLPLLNAGNYARFVEVEGGEHVHSALRKGKGVILLAMHFGSWELSGIAGSMFGRPYRVMVKEQKIPRLNDLLNSYRRTAGPVVLQREGGLKDFVKSLRNNELVGMVADQGGREGVEVPFFGRPASLSPGAVRLALRTGVAICFVEISRIQGARHRIVIRPPMDIRPSGDEERDVRHYLGEIAGLMEAAIRTHPEEYMWSYKIWKYSRHRSILILNDGRTGHLRQSQAVAGRLREALTARGQTYAVQTVNVVYQKKSSRQALSTLTAFLPARYYQGRIDLLRRFLDPESYRQIASVRADYVISCGTACAPVNFLTSRDQEAKSIVVLKPGALDFDRFDLVFLPQHDRFHGMEEYPNIAVTRGAPNLITPEYLERQVKALRARFSHLKFGERFRIGILLGGDTKDYVLSYKKVRMVIHQVKEVAEQLNADILITTSRRTSAPIENLVQKELRRYPRCRLSIIANHHDIPEVMGGILGLADVLVVSGDSISMISEAANSGKKTIVFYAQEGTGTPWLTHKHNRFIDLLNEQGYILSAEAGNISRTIYNVAKSKIQTRRLDDNAVITEHLNKIL